MKPTDNNSQTVWERIVNEPVESTIKRISAGIVNEMALPLSTFRQRVDGLLFQLIENWCLLKYCQLYSPNNVNIDHWGSEFLACADYIRGPEIKGGMNKQTTINKMFVVDYDYNQSRKILPTIQDKFDLAKICDSTQRENVAKEFSHSINELITFLSDTSISNAEYMKTTFTMDNYAEGFWTEVSGAMEHYFKKHGGFPIPNIYAKSLLKNPNLELDIDKYHYVGELGLPDANGNRKTDKKCIFGFNSVEFYNEVINKFEEYASFRDYVISDDKLPPKQKAESSKYLFIEIGMPEMVNDSIGYINYIEEMVHENGTNLTCMTPNMYSMLKRAVAILKDSLTTIHERFVSQISSNIEMGEDLLAETYPVEIHPITKDDY